jgi:N-methylhydantoinase B/oxoprolinase/acetone carboxylase alpha subunit
LNGAPMPGKFAVRVDAGARLRIETPGGGGFGAP